jgi:hypothetical protein
MPLNQLTAVVPSLADAVHRSCAVRIEPNSAATGPSARIFRLRNSFHHRARARHGKHCGKVAAKRTVGIDAWRGPPESVDVAYQCLDRGGDASRYRLLGFGADDHFFIDAGRSGSFPDGKVGTPPGRI